jgi:hypothetical protein
LAQLGGTGDAVAVGVEVLVTVAVAGVPVGVAVGGTPQPGNLKLPIRVLQDEPEVVARYSFVYQKVQSSEGSMDMEL